MKAIFAAGCFWGVEEAFRTKEGVLQTRVGYCGGSLQNPSYKDVCRGDSGHAEAVEITYDPKKVTYEELLALFWELHDPTQIGRQGPDVGEEYRSVIFYTSTKQKELAEKSKAVLQKTLEKPIQTQIMPEQPFFLAEEYHQQFLHKRGKKSCLF